jgi:hypothetical protein
MDIQRSPNAKKAKSGKSSQKKGKSPTAEIRQQLDQTNLNGVQGFEINPQKCTTRPKRK